MSGMLLHCGAKLVPREAVEVIPAPQATRTYTPIPHIELLEAVQREVTSSNLLIESEELALSNSRSGVYGDRFFGLLQIKSRDNETYAMMVGIRNSHSKEFPAGLCVGSRTLICDNLAFSSEIVIARRHTRFIRKDLPRLINDAVGRLGDLRDFQNRRIEAYQNTALSDPQLNDLAIRSLDAGVLAASKLPRLLAEYREPSHEEFRPQTVWSAFCAYTETLKDYDLQDLPRRTQALHGLCDMICGLS